MAKIERRYMAHYINTAPEDGLAVYERIGRDLEEYSPEMAAKVEKKQNILGETKVMITGYEKAGKVETYFADAKDRLFARLQAIVDEEQVLDKCKTDVVEVHLWEEEAVGKGYPALRQSAMLEVTSYGGDTKGYQIPFTVHYQGVPEKGWFDPAAGKFTGAAE